MDVLRENQLARVAVVVVLAVAIAVIAILLSGGGDDDGGDDGPRLVTVEELEEIADELGHPIYWAGERPGTRLEYEQTDDGLIYIRYLTDDAAVGDPSNRTELLTVGTYTVGNAIADLREVAKRPATVTHDLQGGGLVVINTEQPRNVYVAYRGSDQQIEVYDPDARTAIRVATGGEIVPID